MTEKLRQRKDKAPIDDFQEIFVAEHREIRDVFIALYDALGTGNMRRMTELMKTLETFCGPHFRYLEEALYPALEPILGMTFIETMFRKHDNAIVDSLQLAAIIDKHGLRERDAKEGQRLVRRMLPYVSDCEGLSIMVEVLPDSEVRKILDVRERSLRDNFSLFGWALHVRGPRHLSLG